MSVAPSPVDQARTRTVGAEDCRTCHPQQGRSWFATYHRTMTQPAQGHAVLAPFRGEELDYLGFRATMSRTSAGKPHLRVQSLADPEADPLLDVDVELTVGSHRYQQYVAQIDRGGGALERWRLPVAWHLGEKRWIHMNAAFVEPDGDWGEPDNYLRHLSRWNDNCLFCHNTEAAPGKGEDGVFATELAEYGIACEACHGRGGGHSDRFADPFARLVAKGEGDAGIAHPRRMTPGRESAICGRCHGQRIGRDIAKVLKDGDGFVPGRDLSEVSRPIFRDSQVEGVPASTFATRFWPDGTPRLSAYEYQGLLLSPCYAGGKEGGLGCGYCHDMHGDQPAGQLREGRDGAGACVGCHDPGGLDGAKNEGHARHRDAAPGVDCLDCHMPELTYGLLQGMRSHRVTSPDPAAWVGRHDQPDACTQCHVDRSREWAARGMSQLSFGGSEMPGSTPSAGGKELPQVLRDLYGADALQRNLAAHALASEGATATVSERIRWLAPALDDEYASVRWFAWQGLRALAARLPAPELSVILESYDYIGDPAHRVELSSKIRAWVTRRAGAPRAWEAGWEDSRRALAEQRQERELWIGE